MNEQSSYQYLSIQSKNEQTLLNIEHPAFSAVISQYGGQLLSFKPTNGNELIWLSNSAVTDGTKAIRGGAPICWPWFGQAPEQFEGEPQHGYARSVNWQLVNIEENSEFVRIELSPLFHGEIKQKLQLSLKLVYTFSHDVTLSVLTTNQSNEDFELNTAIHTYFDIGSTQSVNIPELKDISYLDKLTSNDEIQTDDFEVSEAMDRIYQLQQPQLNLLSEQGNFKVEMSGHDSVVVWNPWQQGAHDMSDFDNDGYKKMLCVEAAVTNGFKLKPGQQHIITQKFGLID